MSVETEEDVAVGSYIVVSTVPAGLTAFGWLCPGI